MELAASPIARGRTAEILAHGSHQVVKLFLADVDPQEIALEEANSQRAHACGATPIACHGRITHGGRTGLIFDRLQGQSLTATAERNLLLLGRSGRQLAEAHVSMHARTDGAFEPLAHALHRQLSIHAFSFLSAAQRDRAADYINQLPGGSAVLHLDFHTQNVFLHQGTLATIDWQTTACGPPAADVAMTLFLLSEAELWPGISLFQLALYNAVRRILRNYYLNEYRRRSGMTLDEIARYRLSTLILRLGQWQIQSETPKLQAEIRKLLGADL